MKIELLRRLYKRSEDKHYNIGDIVEGWDGAKKLVDKGWAKEIKPKRKKKVVIETK
jgi:hypothetical protein